MWPKGLGDCRLECKVYSLQGLRFSVQGLGLGFKLNCAG